MRIIFALLLAVVASQASAVSAPVGLTGSWAGDMRQIEANTETSYRMTLSLAGKTGSTDYPTLNCSGTWTKVAEKDGYVIYSEKITNRKGATCVDGMVVVTIDQGKVVLGWFASYDGAPTVATAVLSKAAK